MKTTVGTRFTFINMIISIIYHNPHIGVQKVSTPIELRELHYIDRLLATSTSHLRYRRISFIVRFHFIFNFFFIVQFLSLFYIHDMQCIYEGTHYLWILLIVIISIVMMVVRIAIVMVMVVCIAI